MMSQYILESESESFFGRMDFIHVPVVSIGAVKLCSFFAIKFSDSFFTKC